MFPAILALAACQTPFGVDRHDLEGFRIAALSASEAGGVEVSVAPALVVDGHLWSEEAIDLRWYWLDDIDDFEEVELDAPDGTGPQPGLVLNGDRRLLGLVAGDDEYRAFAEILEDGVTLPAFSLRVDPLDSKGKATLTALAAWPDLHARWMATGGRFSELDALSTDWKPPSDAYEETVLTLVLDDLGHSAWAITDLLSDPDPLAGAWIGARWIPSDIPLAPGTFQAVLTRDDQASAGVRVASAELAEAVPPICTGSVSGPFDPRWLADGRCLRSEVVDVPLLLVIE